MNVTDAIKTRRTVRAFKADSVPQALLEDILDAARFSASNCNTQPWYLTVVSGDAKDALKKELMAELMAGKAPSPAFKAGDMGLTGVYKDRQYDCAATYYGQMGIGRADKDKRNALMAKNWEFFGAPHVAFLSMPKSMGEVNAIDLGIYLQSFMLLLVEHGLASCPQGALAFYPDPVFNIAKLPEDHGIICGISFGYEEKGAQINGFKLSRADLSDVVQFIS